MVVKLEISDVSDIVKSIGANNFPEKILTFIQDYVGIDHCTAIWIGPVVTEPALFFTHGLTQPPDEAEKVAQKYVERFRQDPNYLSVMGTTSRQEGTLLPFPRHKIDDPSYVKYFYTEVGVVDKVSTVTSVEGYKILTNFYRLAPSPEFDENERTVLREILPLIAGLIGNHFLISVFPNQQEVEGKQLSKPNSANAVQDVKLLIDNVEEPFSTLSVRERQICEGIVLGQSTENLADTLDISQSTVITYRRRAYGKLGVYSANELLRLLLKVIEHPT